MTCGSGSFIDRVVPDKPLGLVDFTAACYFHDGMYTSSLPSPRWTRKYVDRIFLTNMMNAAATAARWYKPRWFLNSLAYVYYGGVRLFGGSAWKKARRSDAN